MVSQAVNKEMKVLSNNSLQNGYVQSPALPNPGSIGAGNAGPTNFNHGFPGSWPPYSLYSLQPPPFPSYSNQTLTYSNPTEPYPITNQQYLDPTLPCPNQTSLYPANSVMTANNTFPIPHSNQNLSQNMHPRYF